MWKVLTIQSAVIGREQLIHQLKLNEKEHDEKLQREKAKRMAKVQVSRDPGLACHGKETRGMGTPRHPISSGVMIHCFSVPKTLTPDYLCCGFCYVG